MSSPKGIMPEDSQTRWVQDKMQQERFSQAQKMAEGFLSAAKDTKALIKKTETAGPDTTDPDEALRNIANLVSGQPEK